jgi:hypothetical protein
LLIGLIVIGQMIYIAYQVSRITKSIDDSIKEINQEIYPKEISLHLKELLQQLKSLDQYSTQSKFNYRGKCTVEERLSFHSLQSSLIYRQRWIRS